MLTPCQSLLLTPLRQVQLDVGPLVARLRTVCGYVRVGDRWGIFNTTTGSIRFYEDPLVKMGKLISVIPVQNGHQIETWCLDEDGRIFVWSRSVQDDSDLPEFIGEMVDPSWTTEDGHACCFQQVHPHQVWVGTSTGRVLAWDISSRHPITSHSPTVILQCTDLENDSDPSTMCVRSWTLIIRSCGVLVLVPSYNYDGSISKKCRCVPE